MRANQYSHKWFSTFLRTIPPSQTAAEVAFLQRQLSLPCQILDVCCGNGRHALPLAQLGFEVTGLDRNESAIQEANERVGKLRATFISGDVRNHAFSPGSFNAITVLWQSFGFFSPMENRRLLLQWRESLKPRGLLVLDVYHRGFFAGKDGVYDREGVRETRRLRGAQLFVRLDYSPTEFDEFQWELFTPEDLTTLAQECGFKLTLACTEFDEKKPPSAESPRMQLVFQTQF